METEFTSSQCDITSTFHKFKKEIFSTSLMIFRNAQKCTILVTTLFGVKVVTERLVENVSAC